MNCESQKNREEVDKLDRELQDLEKLLKNKKKPITIFKDEMHDIINFGLAKLASIGMIMTGLAWAIGFSWFIHIGVTLVVASGASTVYAFAITKKERDKIKEISLGEIQSQINDKKKEKDNKKKQYHKNAEQKKDTLNAIQATEVKIARIEKKKKYIMDEVIQILSKNPEDSDSFLSTCLSGNTIRNNLFTPSGTESTPVTVKAAIYIKASKTSCKD